MAINGQWGSQQYTGNSAPNWFKKTAKGNNEGTYPANNVIYARANHPADNHNLELTDRGWEKVVRYTDSGSNVRTKREVVIATGGLANTVAYAGNAAAANTATAGPVITGIRWHTANNDTGLISGGAGGDNILYPTSGGVGVIVTFSEPVILINAGLGTTDYAKINVASTVTEGGDSGGGDLYHFIDCRHVGSGNGTNELVFTNATAVTTEDIFSLEDSLTFIELAGVADLVAAQTYRGRGTDTLTYTSGKRAANVSSYGVGLAHAVTGDVVLVVAGQTFAADCGTRVVK